MLIVTIHKTYIPAYKTCNAWFCNLQSGSYSLFFTISFSFAISEVLSYRKFPYNTGKFSCKIVRRCIPPSAASLRKGACLPVYVAVHTKPQVNSYTLSHGVVEITFVFLSPASMVILEPRANLLLLMPSLKQ